MQSAAERREKLLSILSEGKQMSFREIQEALRKDFTFSKRTLQRDIVVLSTSNAIVVKKGCKGGVNLFKGTKVQSELHWSDEIMSFLQELCETLEDPVKILLLQTVMHPDAYFNNLHGNMEKEQEIQVQDMPPPLLMTVDEFRSYLGIGRTKALQLIHEKGCPYVVIVGKRWYINRKKFDAWLEERTGSE